jgi:hypothetical protein
MRNHREDQTKNLKMGKPNPPALDWLPKVSVVRS